MVEVVAIVEGQTEQTFVRDLLAGHLSLCGVSMWAVLSGKSRKSGGVKKWQSSCDDIVRTLKEGHHCTTMFDFYALPNDWPGRIEAAKLPWAERSAHVEAQLLADIAARLGGSFNPARFLPYVQLHEFEALVFADTDKLAEATSGVCTTPATRLSDRFGKIVADAGEPEAIDDGYDTCLSRRITSVVPGYRKRIHGPIVAQRIGLDRLRAKCAHFAEWLGKLERVGSSATGW